MLVAVTGYAAWRYARRIPVTRLPELASGVITSITRRRFDESIHLLEAHFGSIRDALAGEYWQARLRRRFYPTPGEIHRVAAAYQRAHANKRQTVSRTDSGGRSINMPAAKEPSGLEQWFIDRSNRPIEAAQDIVRTIGLSPGVIDDIAESNPYLGLALMQVESTWAVREFAERFAEALLKDNQSAFYRELRRAENVDAHSVPLVDPIEQPILAALVADVGEVAGPRFVFTFVDAGINAIRHGRSPDVTQILRGPLGSFHDSGRWTCPPFASIYIVAIVAPVNAIDPEAPMLNLYALDSLAGTLLGDFPEEHELESIAEWPTPTHYLLYEIISTLKDLVRIWQRRPEALGPIEARRKRSSSPRHLPEHAAEVLGAVMSRCLASTKLGNHFKGYLLGVWWNVYTERHKGNWEHSDKVLDALIRGGHLGTNEPLHLNGLATALEHIDIVDRVSNAADLLRERAGLPEQ